MNNKTNSGNRDDSPASSSSITKSPYNLRRNQAQPGAVTKRNNLAKSKKDISVTISPTPNRITNSSIQQSVSNPSQQSSSDDDDQLNGNNDVNIIDRSDDEQEATIVKQHAERENNKLQSVKSHFDHVDDNVYLCLFCFKVSM
jgi:RNA polymerase-binding transcription factor DksA